MLVSPTGWTAGLDYLRISYDVSDAVQINAYAQRRIAELAHICYRDDVMPATSQITLTSGYGWRAGRSISIIVHRYSNRITEIASGAAARWWTSPGRLMYNVSVGRADVAIDVRYAESESADAAIDLVDHQIGNLYDKIVELRDAGVGNWRKRAVTLLQSAGGGATVYLNRRTSEVFVRLYNKTWDLGRQNIPTNTPILRIELEAKGRGVGRIAPPELIATDRIADYVEAGVSYIVRMLDGVITLEGAPDRNPYYMVRLDESDFVRSLRWIERAVVPTLYRLTSSGYEQELAGLGIVYTPPRSVYDDDVPDTDIDYDATQTPDA